MAPGREQLKGRQSFERSLISVKFLSPLEVTVLHKTVRAIHLHSRSFELKGSERSGSARFKIILRPTRSFEYDIYIYIYIYGGEGHGC